MKMKNKNKKKQCILYGSKLYAIYKTNPICE